jgi:hypothetical protein
MFMAYRDEREALAARCEQLEVEIERLRTMRGRVERLERELEDARSRLRSVAPEAERSLLDRVRVASPCNAVWSDMVGNDQVRHCAQCDKNVYDLSAMTRAEAESVIEKHEGKLCARFYRRADGTVLTQDCPVGQRRRRRRVSLVVLGSSALAALGVAGYVVHAQNEAAYEAYEEVRDQLRMQRAGAPFIPTAPAHVTGHMTMGDVRVSADAEAAAERALIALQHAHYAAGGVDIAETDRPPHARHRHARGAR